MKRKIYFWIGLNILILKINWNVAMMCRRFHTFAFSLSNYCLDQARKETDILEDQMMDKEQV